MIILLICNMLFANNIKEILFAEAQLANIDPEIVFAIAFVESSFKTHITGDKGKSKGIMQIQLRTARHMGFKGTEQELMDPQTNIRYSLMYINYLNKHAKGNLYKALDWYNRGMKQGKLYPYKKRWINHKYVGKILKYVYKNQVVLASNK